jgi:hypothetical protein
MQPPQDAARDFHSRRDREQRRHYARRPKKISDVLAQLITTRGYGRIQSDANLASAWRRAAGERLAPFTRPGRVRRGILEITANNSAIVQELTFQKQHIISRLQADLSDAAIHDIRFRIGSI